MQSQWKCTWQKNENDTQDIGKEKEETSFAVVEITFLANTKSCNVERHSSLKVHNLFCLGQTLANINMGDIEDCIQQGKLALQNLKKKPPPKNIQKDVFNALIALKKDLDRLVLSADKGNCVVVLDKQQYHDKALSLLNNKSMYAVLNFDPTIKL